MSARRFDDTCIGGPANGRRRQVAYNLEWLFVPHRDGVLIEAQEDVDDDRPFSTFQYRRHTFCDDMVGFATVWLPADVPRGGEMDFVIGLALHGTRNGANALDQAKGTQRRRR